MLKLLLYNNLEGKGGQEGSGGRKNICISSVQFSSVAQSCPTLCDPMNRITPGLPVHHQLPEFTQTHAQIYVYPWPIHADVWEKPSQFCKVIIHQLKFKK